MHNEKHISKNEINCNSHRLTSELALFIRVFVLTKKIITKKIFLIIKQSVVLI